ncbi:uncharacterized protein LOC128883847 isoform X2 [Hylaeus volcanicus]|uniref:uncharacterized protein LOC128883847 isoform X2 n=1 Tax=Hylaeus volcanicus TaxID=313075 RepID=UPI0023B7E6F9|nr:uncharacterized protein LOC128883847 isoform X2 [Hylaeus volcanicus]
MPVKLRDLRNWYNPKHLKSFSSLEFQPKQCKLVPPKPVNSFSSPVIFNEKRKQSKLDATSINTGLRIARQSDLSLKSRNPLNRIIENVEKVCETLEKENDSNDSSQVKAQMSSRTSNSKGNVSITGNKDSSLEGKVESHSAPSNGPQMEKESDHTAPSTSLTQALLGSVSLGPTIVIRSLTSDQKATCQPTVNRTWCKPPTREKTNPDFNITHTRTMFQSSLQFSTDAENAQFPRVDEVAHFKNDIKTFKGNRYFQDVKKTLTYVPTESIAKLNTLSSYAVGKKLSPRSRLPTPYKQFSPKTRNESDTQKERDTEFYENFSKSFSFHHRLPSIDQFVLPCHLTCSAQGSRLSHFKNSLYSKSSTAHIPTIPKLCLNSSPAQHVPNETTLHKNENVKIECLVSCQEKNSVEASTQTTLHHCQWNNNILLQDVLVKNHHQFQRETVCQITTNGFHGSLILKECDFLVQRINQSVVSGGFEKRRTQTHQLASEQNNVFKSAESNNTKCRLSSNHSNNSISETSLCNDIYSPFPRTKVNQTYTPAKVTQEFNFLSDINQKSSDYFNNNSIKAKDQCLHMNVTQRYKDLSDEFHKNQRKIKYTAPFQNKVTDFYKNEFSTVEAVNSNSKNVVQKTSSRDFHTQNYNASYKKSDTTFDSSNELFKSRTTTLLKNSPHVTNIPLAPHKISCQSHLPVNNYHSHRNYHFQPPCNKSSALLDINKKSCRSNHFSNSALTKNGKEISNPVKPTLGKQWNHAVHRHSNSKFIFKSNEWKPAKALESKILLNEKSLNAINYNMELTSPLYSSTSYAVNPVRYVSNKI